MSQAPAVLEDSRLMRLVRDRFVRPAKVPLSKALLSGPLPVPKDGASAVAALLDERQHGR